MPATRPGLAESRGEPEPLPGRAVDPGPQPLVADVEGEPAKHRHAGFEVVQELLGARTSAIDRLDDHPLVPHAAPRLALDELAGQPVADQTGRDFLGRLS